MKRFSCFLATFALLLLTATASLADSARDMLESGRVDDAINTLNTRLSSAPTDAQSANLLCRAYFTLEEWDRAESSCKQAVALDPGNGSYHRWLAHVYGEKADRASFLTAVGLARKTREELERAVQLDPGDIDARVDLAEFYIEAPGLVGGGEDKARAEAKQLGAKDSAREHCVYDRGQQG
jgi:cytochrome c-type biogenesis protein CcmH/NrfG